MDHFVTQFSGTEDNPVSDKLFSRPPKSDQPATSDAVIERGKRLAADPDYPSSEIIREVAKKLLDEFKL
jgi:hypothetical protein